MKEYEQKEQQMRLERLKKKVSVTATRDPQRLLRPTIGWEERQKAGQGSGLGGPMTSLPKRYANGRLHTIVSFLGLFLHGDKDFHSHHLQTLDICYYYCTFIRQNSNHLNF